MIEEKEADLISETQKKTTRQKGIALIPNLLTTGALFCGFYAILAGINGLFTHAAIAIFISMIFDGLDGRVARMTNTQSDFGAEYDSLADLISFGLAPGLLMYTWSLKGFGQAGFIKEDFIAAFIYIVCAALRLARFNTSTESIDKNFFQGLPSPAAAAMMVSTVWVCEKYGISGHSSLYFQYAMAILSIIIGLLMVSDLRFYSFKELVVRDRVPFIYLVIITILIPFAFLKTAELLFIIFTVYISSGLWIWLAKRRELNALNVEIENKEETEKNDEI